MENTTAAKVSAALEETGVSKLQLSLLAGIPYTTLGRCLMGTRDFRVSEIMRIGDALEVEPGTLLPERKAS